MSQVGVLAATAASVGFLHTLLGPDHYIPFIAMARANRWRSRRLVLITAACGFAHVGSSIVIGALGVMLGQALMKLEALESFRGEAAAWLLIGFGLAYLTWGLWHAQRKSGHVHATTTEHEPVHEHRHHRVRPLSAWSPWCLFLIFAFGPCEALIPLMMVPAAQNDWFAILAVSGSFALTTVATMLCVVLLGNYGASWLRFADLHRFGHAMAGLVVLICGVTVKLGL